MASISNGLVLTTAMVVSTTVLYLAFSRHKTHSPSFQIPTNSNPNKQILRSCLCSEEKRRERKKMKKRVKFAENVMLKEERKIDEKIKEERRMQNRVSNSGNCRNGSMENRGMPENRVALYKGMLRDRGNRIACCH
ncbi:hypothetical protein RIF29_28646 [Crotalaria pallida]|uniref:Transmembrane protein n=1 Tax=Crotalaria pallida TaxID=3830 RepID=A0AAN9EIB0_CROPI